MAENKSQDSAASPSDASVPFLNAGGLPPRKPEDPTYQEESDDGASGEPRTESLIESTRPQVQSSDDAILKQFSNAMKDVRSDIAASADPAGRSPVPSPQQSVAITAHSTPEQSLGDVARQSDTSEAEDLKSQNELLGNLTTEMNQRIIQFTKRVQDSRENLEALHTRLRGTDADVTDLISSPHKLNRSVNAQSIRISDLQNTRAVHNRAIKELERKQEVARRKHNWSAQVHKGTRDNQNDTGEAKDRKSENEWLRDVIAAIKQQRTDVQKETSLKAETIAQKVNMNTQSLRKVVQSVSELKADQEALRSRAEDLDRSQQRTSEDVTTLTSSHNNTDKVKYLESENERLWNVVDKMKQQLTDVKKELESRMNHTEQGLNTLSENVEDLRDDVCNLQRGQSDTDNGKYLESENERLWNVRDEMKQQLTDVKKDIAAFQNSISREVEDLKKDQEEHVEHSERRGNELNRNVNAQSNQISDLQNKRAVDNQAIKELERNQKVSRRKHAWSAQVHKGTRDNQNDLRDDVGNLQRDQSAAATRVSQLQQEMAANYEELDWIVTQSGNEIDELMALLDGQTTSVAQGNSRLSGVERGVATLRRDLHEENRQFPGVMEVQPVDQEPGRPQHPANPDSDDEEVDPLPDHPN